MPAMPAGVGEGARLVAEGEHQSDVAHLHLPMRSTGGQFICAADAGPVGGEEVPPLPGQYVGIGVGLARQHHGFAVRS
jgi:hypothetical protein